MRGHACAEYHADVYDSEEEKLRSAGSFSMESTSFLVGSMLEFYFQVLTHNVLEEEEFYMTLQLNF